MDQIICRKSFFTCLDIFLSKSKINYHSLLKLSDEYATFDNKKGQNK